MELRTEREDDPAEMVEPKNIPIKKAKVMYAYLPHVEGSCKGQEYLENVQIRVCFTMDR